MKQKNSFKYDMLDFDLPEAKNDILWIAEMAEEVYEQCDGSVIIKIPFQAQKKEMFVPDATKEKKYYYMEIKAYGDAIVRCSISFSGRFIEDSNNPMIEWDPSLKQVKLYVTKNKNGWDIIDDNKVVRMRVNNVKKPTRKWSNLHPEAQYFFDATIFPDGIVAIPFMANDTFTPGIVESVSLGYVERDGKADRCVFALHSEYNEKFAGTGERFTPMNLSGKTIILENNDALGVNNRRAYKNVPFYISSKGYGLLIMTSAHVRLSLADISTRAVQALIEDDVLDLFFIGGGEPERIIYNYRRISGFPRKVPVWSYGIWMSRMSYFSAEETFDVAKRLRENKFPCDVIHLDTGWFKKDWQCDWEFDEERFPNPQEYIRNMHKMGFKISVWQLPHVAAETKHYNVAVENKFISKLTNKPEEGTSNFGDVEYRGVIDFTNPKAVEWYQNLLKNLFDLGVDVIKTDFGENIDMNAEYFSMEPKKLHNVYSLLYQKAAFEITEEVKGKGQAIIWARAGWIGCQRYPVHWGGDSSSTWDGLAATIRGGLHLGVSGFGFWSHDVPGFHGLPDFMNNWPDDDIYVRWTQVAVFTSHIRYHGTSPREPYNYPNVSDIVREWWKLRYALIPYLVEQGEKVTKTGYPFIRALLIHHPDDEYCWYIDDEFYCGDIFLVAPIINSAGKRNIYLPKGNWIDFWSGEFIEGPVMLKDVYFPLEKMPIYCVAGSELKVYPYIVQHTGEIEFDKAVTIIFDHTYKGFSKSILGKIIKL